MSWREWWADLSRVPIGGAIDDLQKLHEGYRILAEALEAYRKANNDEHDFCLVCEEQVPHHWDNCSIGKALAHLRGVASD